MEGGSIVTMFCRMLLPGEAHFEDLCEEGMRPELRMYRIDEERADCSYRFLNTF